MLILIFLALTLNKPLVFISQTDRGRSTRLEILNKDIYNLYSRTRFLLPVTLF